MGEIATDTKIFQTRISSEILSTIEARLKPIYEITIHNRPIRFYKIETSFLSQLPKYVQKMVQDFMTNNSLLALDKDNYYFKLDADLQGTINYLEEYLADNYDIS